MNSQEFSDFTRTRVIDNRCQLAMDGSNPSCNKRFGKLGNPLIAKTCRAYRQLIVITPDSVSASVGRSSTMEYQLGQRRATLSRTARRARYALVDGKLWRAKTRPLMEQDRKSR